MDSGSTTPLEDGSTAVYDANGTLTSIIASDGTVIAADTSIESDFKNLITSSFGSYIRQAFAVKPAAAPAAAAAAAPATSLQKYLPLGVLGVLALIAYRALA